MKGLNLASFKKMKEDSQCVTMVHKDGHQLVISKGSLTPLHRKQIEALPLHNYAMGEQKMNKGGMVQHYDDGTGDAQPASSSGPGASVADIQAYNSPMEAEAIDPNSPDAQPNAQAPAPQPDQTQAPIAQDQTSQAQSPAVAQQSGFAQEQAANTALAGEIGKAGKAESGLIQGVQDKIDSGPSANSISDNYKKGDLALSQAYQAQKLDPDAYWTSKDQGGGGHSKVAAGIGLLLSSLGQAAGAKGGNAALDAINTGINRELEVQKNNQGKALTLWQMNRQALGNDIAANLATQNQLYTGLQYKLAQAKANASGPIAIQNANIANAKIQQMKDLNTAKLGILGSNSSQDYADPADKLGLMQRFGMIQPDQAAKVASSIDAAKNTVANSKGIDEGFWQAAKDARPLSGGTDTSIKSLIPGQKTPGQQALIARLGPTFSDIEGTVRQAAMDNAEHNMVPAFGDSDEAIQTKWKSLQDYKSSKAAASLAKSYGIDLSKYPSTNINGLRNSPPPGQAATKNGIQYQPQTINGKTYMVPVK